MSGSSLARALVALITAALLAAVPATAVAKPTAKPGKAKSCVKGKKGKQSKGRKRCAKRKPVSVAPATPLKVTLLEGSSAKVEIPAVPLPGGQVLTGTPTTVDIPLTGQLSGDIPGGYQLGRTNDLRLTGGTVGLAPADLLKDPACNGATTLRLNPASTVPLLKAPPSIGKIFIDGRATAAVAVDLGLAFDSRAETGCDKPLITMGMSRTPFVVSLAGQINPTTGLTALTLDSAPTPLSVAVCLAPGAPGAPCATPPAAYPVTITVHAVVRVQVGV